MVFIYTKVWEPQHKWTLGFKAPYISEASRLGCTLPGYIHHFLVGFLGQLWAFFLSAGSVLFQDPGRPWTLNEGEWLAIGTSSPFLQRLGEALWPQALRSQAWSWWLPLSNGSNLFLPRSQSQRRGLVPMMNTASRRLRAYVFFLFWVCLWAIQVQMVLSGIRPYLGWSLKVSAGSGTFPRAWHLTMSQTLDVVEKQRFRAHLCQNWSNCLCPCNPNLETSTELLRFFHGLYLEKYDETYEACSPE